MCCLFFHSSTKQSEKEHKTTITKLVNLRFDSHKKNGGVCKCMSSAYNSNLGPSGCRIFFRFILPYFCFFLKSLRSRGEDEMRPGHKWLAPEIRHGVVAGDHRSTDRMRLYLMHYEQQVCRSCHARKELIKCNRSDE